MSPTTHNARFSHLIWFATLQNTLGLAIEFNVRIARLERLHLARVCMRLVEIGRIDDATPNCNGEEEADDISGARHD